MTNVQKIPRKNQKRKKGLLRSVFSHWQLYAILAVPLILVIIFNYVPMYGVIIAFKDYKVRAGITGSEWIGFKYFEQFFNTTTSGQIIWNTVSTSLYSLYSIIAGFPFPIILAILLNDCRSKGLKKSTQMLTYAPYFISTVVMVAMLIAFLDPQTGVINRFLQMLGLKAQPFISIEKYFRHLYVWSGVWQGAGYGAVIYISALSSVPTEMYEAATIDGVSKLKRIWYIDLPYLIPTATIMLILNFGQIMNVGFEKVYLMQNPANMNVAEVISTYVYKLGLVNMNMSFSTAVNLFNSLINMAMILVVNGISTKLSETSLF